MTDRKLIGRVLAGDAEAFRTLVERYQQPVLCLVRNLLGDRHLSEDIAQDVFLSAWRKLGQYDPGRAALLTWLLAIARNRCMSVMRKRSPLLTDRLPERTDCADPARQAAQAEFFEHLDGALEALPAEQRTAFVLSELMGLSGPEISQIESAPQGTIRSRLSRAKQALREALKPFAGGDA